MEQLPEVTVILLDVSKNMLSSSNQLETKFDNSRYLIQYYLQKCKWNTLSVILFDSKCHILQDFTKNHDQLIMTLNEQKITFEDPNREMKAACEFVEQQVTRTFGSDQACQDGFRSILFRNPLWKLHLICLADAITKSEHSQKTSRILEEYKRLLNRRIPQRITKNHQKGVSTLEKDGAFCYLPYPHFKDSILSMMDSILEKYFLPSRGLLMCGQLRLPIKVYPVLPDVDYVHEMSKTLSIVAFKSKEKLLIEPSILRLWIFIDEEYGDKKEEDKPLQNHSEFFPVLGECLRKENRVAIVWMKGDNYATIEPPPIKDDQEPNDLGSFMYFTIYKSEKGNNLLSKSSSSSSITPPPKSYVSGYIDLPTPEHVESLLNKMSRYLINLPDDALKLKNVVQQMQQIIEIFSYRPLKEQVIDRLHDVRIQTVEADIRQILAECLLMLGEDIVEFVLVAIFNTIQNFLTISLTKRVYSARPAQVTKLASRTFATWTFLSAIVRLYAAYNITDVKTATISTGWLIPVIIASSSLIWMLLQYEYYVLLH
ncbi:5037_t:CDS:10 [Funneliformis geosporum]|uniref:10565_t:CDS:1 n=1 Tax=Funneliformis geosporum TaxID=1117311 RepID=A0A9W4WRZ5_9GLOM|nr:5037_t:CDS:10 [Funneliformis geosporum]CAI2181829.1 10565_t:CDS:10 [Funneliformis geosporum]